MKHRTAILTLSSNSNSGDVAHVNSVCAALSTRMDFTQKLAIDTSSINDDLALEDAARDYHEKISEFDGINILSWQPMINQLSYLLTLQNKNFWIRIKIEAIYILEHINI
jgi:hypothetical protein